MCRLIRLEVEKSVRSRRLLCCRTIFSRKQVESLEELFEADHYPSMEARQKLAKYCGLEEEKIQVGNFV